MRRIAMRFNYLKATLKTAVLAVTVLLLAAGVSLAQSVDLTAGPQNATLPDGQVVPMWGYTCANPVAPATCARLNTNAAVGDWSPVVITVPPGPLTINLTNSLSFTAGTGTNNVPTSLMIVGQLGGGLGSNPRLATPPRSDASPDHSNLPSKN